MLPEMALQPFLAKPGPLEPWLKVDRCVRSLVGGRIRGLSEGDRPVRGLRGRPRPGPFQR